ncbi:hypothetical protein Poli38472_011857 [Pythium oligandrum]|uniref:Uncharacterized protein n=1 Tax=Pythium oligandrum TaxID=41045 RepID=A0A8K1C7U8_PYTOL|nr:hypothetical protein Poli38472_011857 [Pythium oligandrum]|eukprot:TMW58269.1 hypothetical protein Poli38472_011857 [Pythium oligandrum]
MTMMTEEEETLSALAFVDAFELLDESTCDLDALLDDVDTATLAYWSSERPVLEGVTTSDSNDDGNETKEEEAKPRKRRVRTPERMARLKSTVQELEDQLKALQKPRDSSGDSMWGRIAEQQKKERARAEEENARLRAILAQEVDKMSELVVKRKNLELPREFDETIKRRRNTKRIMDDHDALDKQMLAMVTSMYETVDQVLDDPRSHKPKGDRRRVSELSRDEKTGGTVLESLQNQILPFEYHSASDVVWEMMASNPHRQRVTLLDDEDPEDEDMVVQIYDRSIQLPSGLAVNRGKAVSRRFNEANRVIQATVMVTEPVQVADKPLYGVYLQTRLLHVLEPAPMATKGHPLTLKRSLVILEPVVYDPEIPKEELRQVLGMLSWFVQIKDQKILDAHNREFENRLVESLASLCINDEREEKEADV